MKLILEFGERRLHYEYEEEKNIKYFKNNSTAFFVVLFAIPKTIDF